MTENIAYSGEKTARSNGIEIVYDTFGNKDDHPLLLIIGIGVQMILWNEEFCRSLASKGYYVIRFDNRDAGLSTKMDDAGVPDLGEILQDNTESVSYTLSDMAEDSVGLLDALNIDSAHIVGASMGGMIAQTIALNHTKRMRTLTSIMSTTGNPDMPPPAEEVITQLFTPPPPEKEKHIDHFIKLWKLLNGPVLPFDNDFYRNFIGQEYDRNRCPAGFVRQLGAIVASGSRKEALKSLNMPTLVIHGTLDLLVRYECGVDTHEAIAGSKMLTIEDMGHTLHSDKAREVIEAIVKHAV